MQDTLSLRRNENLGQVLYSYYQLTKPRIILLLLFTTAAGLWVAGHGEVDPKIGLITMFTGACAAGAANTINCLYDRDIDQIMCAPNHAPFPRAGSAPAML